MLTEYSQGSAKPVQQAIEEARARKIQDDLDTFLATRFGKSLVPAIKPSTRWKKAGRSKACGT